MKCLLNLHTAPLISLSVLYSWTGKLYADINCILNFPFFIFMQAVIKWKWLKSRLTAPHNNRRRVVEGAVGAALPRRGVSWGNTRTTTFQFSKIFIMLKCRLEANGAKRQSGNVPSKKVDSLPYPSVLVPSTLPSVLLSSLSPIVLAFSLGS